MQVVPNIKCIYTDANSVYDIAYRDKPFKHVMTKRETHLIESLNSSIRDNLTRFNRRTKRFSKTLEMLHCSLTLFFNKKLIVETKN